MTRDPGRPFRFGDIVRDGRAARPDHDDRRWMVIAVAATYAARPWTLLYLDDPVSLSHWPSLTGFEFVEGAAS